MVWKLQFEMVQKMREKTNGEIGFGIPIQAGFLDWIELVSIQAFGS